jgi:ATP-dependent DNA helicase RecG
MLVSDNRRRWSSYRIPSSPHLESSSPHLESSSPHLESSSPHLESSSPHIENQRLKELAKSVACSKRAAKQVVRDIILQLCQTEPLSLGELARLLNRNPKSLQNHYLTQLVYDGVLELQHPETPSHPEQAYMSKGKL